VSPQTQQALSMRISIDATGLGQPKTGTAVYVMEILRQWNSDKSIAHDFVVVGNPHAMAHCTELNLDQRFSFLTAPDQRHLRVFWQQTMLPWHIKRMGIDVHWGTGFVLPLVCNVPQVVTVHDLTYQLFPEVHEWIKRYYFPAIINASVRAAHTVLAVSHATKADLERLVPASRGKTEVTHLAARGFAAGRDAEPESERTIRDVNYLLFIGTIEPRKNLQRLISAWRALDPAVKGDTQLLIVGATGWMVDELMKSISASDNVQFRGHVSDEVLAQLMKNAKSFLYPSLYEGFGLPVLEAMAAGIPVLTSNIGATREIAQDASILVDPMDEADIKAGLIRFFQEPELLARLSVLGKARAAEFSWQRTGRATLEAIERAVTGG
jgi:glycosyltransferase involved in cell wall biosynthesis